MNLLTHGPIMQVSIMVHFTASRRESKSMDNLGAIRQKRDKSLQSYIDRFIKEAILIKDADENMK